MRASLPFSVIFSGWLESPSASTAWAATSACSTLAPPPGTMKLGRLSPSSSKNFFSFATRCWPYTNVETLCDAVIALPCAWAARPPPASRPAPVTLVVARNCRRVQLINDPPCRLNHNILTLQRISAILEHSMIRSMTGFGRAEVRGDTLVVLVEARSVNHRHLDVALRLPRTLTALEIEARKVVAARVERGRVDVSVVATPVAGQSTQRVITDHALAREYAARARALANDLEALGIAGSVTLQWLLERPGVVRLEDSEPLEAAMPWPLLQAALSRALDELVDRRTAEGERLAQELRSLHAELTAIVDTMAARA